MIKPFETTDAKLETIPIQEGQMLYTTDTLKIYLDIDDNTRLEMYSKPDEVIDYIYKITYTTLDNPTFPITEKIIQEDGSKKGNVLRNFITNTIGSNNFINIVELKGTQNIVNFQGMFSNFYNLYSICDFDITNATSLHLLFYNSPNFTECNLKWDWNKCTNISHIFEKTSIINMPNWNLNNINDSSFALCYCNQINNIIPNFNLSNCTETAGMFSQCKKLTGSIPNFDLSNCSNTTAMFYNCSNLTGNIPNFDLSNAKFTKGMFGYCSNLTGNIPNFDLSNCIKIGGNTSISYSSSLTSGIFFECRNLTGNIPNFNLSNCINADFAFRGCSKITGNIPNFNLTNCLCLDSTFAECGGLTGNIPNFNLTNCLSLNSVFFNDYNLTGFVSSNLILNKCKSMYQCFRNCTNLYTEELNIYAPRCTSLFFAFANTKIKNFNLDMPNITNTSSAFRNTPLESFPNMVCTNVINASYMFANCINLINFPEISMLQVTNFKNIFLNCAGITEAGIENLAKSTPHYNNLINTGTNDFLNYIGLDDNPGNISFTSLYVFEAVAQKGWNVSRIINSISSGTPFQ